MKDFISYEPIFVWVMLLCFVSCGGNDTTRISQALFCAEHQKADSALVLLNQINRANLSKEDQAKYSLVYTLAQDKSGIDIYSDSLIGIASGWFKDHPTDTLYARCEYYMGKYYLLNDSVEKAIGCLENSWKAAHASKNYNLECMALEKMSKIYRLSDPEKALKLANLAVALFPKSTGQPMANKVYLLLNQCECLSYVESISKVIRRGQGVLSMARAFTDSAVVSDVYQDLSVFYKIMGENDSSYNSALKAYQWGRTSSVSRKLSLAKALIDVDSIEQASKILQTVKATDTKEKYTLFYLLSSIAFKNNNLISAKNLTDSTYYYLETTYEEAAKSTNNYYLASVQMEKDRHSMQERANRNCWLLILAIVILTGMLVAVLFYFDGKKKRNKMEKELNEKRLRLEIDNRDKQLEAMRIYIKGKVDVAKKITDNKNLVKNKILLTETVWEELALFLNNVDNNFVNRLTTQFPNLKRADVRLMILLRLKASLKIMADIYSISVKGIKQKLYLYKSKVGIEGENLSLRDFIENF